jgi:hypothetical protein
MDDEQNRFKRVLDRGGGAGWDCTAAAAVRLRESARLGAVMVKTSHHDTLGAFSSITADPQVDGVAAATTCDEDLPPAFEAVDEPYMIEVQHPDTRVLTSGS